MVVKVSKPEINVREKISELDKPSGTAGQAMLAAETPQEQFNLIGAGRRNILINGAFEVFQRGAGPASPSSGNSPATADRWAIPNTSEVSEVVANDRASHLTKMLKVTANSSGYGQVAQWIENVRTAAGQSLTVSFWAKSPNAGPLRFHIYQNFGSGGSSTVSVIDDSNYFTINQADTWQRFEATVEIPSVSGKTIGASSYLSVQTGAPSAIANRVVYYSEFQAELGKVATPFEHRSYGEELALCQRYCYVIGHPSQVIYLGTGSMYTSTAVNLSVPLPVQLRTTSPSFTRVANGTGNWLNVYVGATGTVSNATPLQGDYTQSNLRIYITSAHSGSSPSAAGAGVWSMVLAGAQLIINAEL